MMPAKSGNENRRLEHGAKSVLQSAVYSQPWWHGVENNDSLGDSAVKSSSMEHLNGSVRNGVVQSQANGGVENGANFNKGEKTTVASQSDGSIGQEHQHINKHGPSSTFPTMGEHLDPNSQMELVGHSIVLTSYPYSDPQYGGMLASYGPQAMIPHQLYGIHQARMPLPLDMEEEPVYVNAKQYHGILRRRQSRAKAELEKKVIKVRKPYLHESRHKHAMKRARGCGGRFLNTKKPDNNVANPTPERGMNSGSNHSTQSTSSSGSECLPTHGNSDSSHDQQEGSRSVVHNVYEAHNFSNAKSYGHGLLSINHSPSSDGKEGDFLGQQRERMQGEAEGIPPIQLVGETLLV